MTILKAAAILTLWRSRQFDTHDIAKAIGADECDVCRVLAAARERERGPDLHVVESGR
jgi:hypothetical protein